MFVSIILILISETQLSLQLSRGFCKNKITGNAECCYNFENINDMCTQCKKGTVSQPGGRCLPCKQNKYGIKCLDDCECNSSQRCDPVIGCILKTVSTIDTRNIAEYSFTTQKFETTHLIQDSTLRTGTQNMEWIIYTLCVVGFLIIIGLSHFVRSYRKRLSKNVRRENRGEEIEMRQERVEQPYIGIYDEIDESLVGVDNRVPRVIPQLRNTRAKINDVRTMKINSDQEDNSSYLDPVFAVNETESQSSLKESSSSHSSNVDFVFPDYTGYLNPYQPLNREQQISDGYAVAIHVHQNSESLSGFVSSEDGSSAYKYFHVYQQLQQDQRTNAHVYGKATPNEKEINHNEINDKESCSNRVAADRKGIDSSDLLHDEETDEQINEHALFGCQTLGDDACENTDTFINADDEDNKDSLENADKPMNKNNNQTIYDLDCTEYVPHVDISNEYLEMQNLTKKDEM